MTDEILKAIPESQVIDEVKQIITATGIKLQRINTPLTFWDESSRVCNPDCHFCLFLMIFTPGRSRPNFLSWVMVV